MLAQNFRTPAKLKIQDAEFEALVKVLGMLERGELIDTTQSNPDNIAFGFFMGCQYKKRGCGTVACIGGWVAQIMGLPDPTKYVDRYMSRGALHALYWAYPSDVEVRHAALALRNFLTTGKPRWDEVMRMFAFASAVGQHCRDKHPFAIAF